MYVKSKMNLWLNKLSWMLVEYAELQKNEPLKISLQLIKILLQKITVPRFHVYLVTIFYKTILQAKQII